MDRRSWLWRRKASDKSSGETESLGSGSGSMSSPSERFSDEQQVYSMQNAQSPEVNLKHVEDTNDSLKILSAKLADAVATINEKEELVKQHAKVAEEAVTGWESVENEMNALSQQLDAATKKNATLEGKIVHLDGALKECLRQLRQIREEQDQKKSENSENSESEVSSLHSKLSDISAQLELSNASKTDLLLKLELSEKENATLQLQIRSQSEALELRTLERDLSTKRAESASKQHLEGIKKVAKLEAECRSLKFMARKGTTLSNGPNLPTEPKLLDNLSNTGFMDDFLEMEQLVSQPVVESRRCNESENENGEINRITELEEMIEKLEAEKVELGLTLVQCQDCLQISESSFKQLEIQLSQCQNQLKLSESQVKEANKRIGILEGELDLANELRQAIDLELDDANVRREESMIMLEKEKKMYLEASEKCPHLEDEIFRMRGVNEQKEALESELEAVHAELKSLLSKVDSLENEGEKERKMYLDASEKCRHLEDEIFRMRGVNEQKETLESELKAVNAELKSLLSKVDSFENDGEKERKMYLEASEKCGVLEDEIFRMRGVNEQKEALESELEGLQFKIGSLENEREKERRLLTELESELYRTKDEVDKCKSQLISVNESNEAVTGELKMVNVKKEELEMKLEGVQEETESLLARIGSLEHEMEKERIPSLEFAAKCRKLEKELSKMKSAGALQFVPLFKEEFNKQQEKEKALAASKLSECQKTIASLGNQLKLLAKLDDLFSDSDLQLDTSDNEHIFDKESQFIRIR